jgi:hypothetical protein
MKGLFSLLLIGGLVMVLKSQEPEIRRYLKIRSM